MEKRLARELGARTAEFRPSTARRNWRGRSMTSAFCHPEDAALRLRRQGAQVKLRAASEARRPGRRSGASPRYSNRVVDLIARGLSGRRARAGRAVKALPVTENEHRNHILQRSVCDRCDPSGRRAAKPRTSPDASPLALGYVGVFAVRVLRAWRRRTGGALCERDRSPCSQLGALDAWTARTHLSSNSTHPRGCAACAGIGRATRRTGRVDQY